MTHGVLRITSSLVRAARSRLARGRGRQARGFPPTTTSGSHAGGPRWRG